MSTTVAVRERPILFSGPMVRALLDGRKTQTRRVVTDRNSLGNAKASQLDLSRAWVDAGPSPAGNVGPYLKSYLAADFVEKNGWPKDGIIERLYPRWEVGDRMWVRESARCISRSTYDTRGASNLIVEYAAGGSVSFDFADTESRWIGAGYPDRSVEGAPRWRPSIHMPRWASRITLEITDVRVQRVQEISAADCYAEGVKAMPSAQNVAFVPGTDIESDHRDPSERYRRCFAELWDSINAPRGFGWASNPWVWALSFRVVFP